MIKSADPEDNRSWTALKANAEQAAFLGGDQLEINAQHTDIYANKVANDADNVIDFAHDPLQIKVGDGAYTDLDFAPENGQIMGIQTKASMNLFDFFQTEGDLSFEVARREVDIMDTDHSVQTVEMNVMTVGAAGFTAIAQQGTAHFSLSGVDFGLAMISDPLVEGNFLSLQASAAEFIMTAAGVEVVGKMPWY
jgi:hypothetical protein